MRKVVWIFLLIAVGCCQAREDGEWSGWEAYTECDMSCGGGVQVQFRQCDNPAPADGGDECLFSDRVTRGLEEQEVFLCNEQPCPIDGVWSGWQETAGCSADCGGGNHIETRLCDNPPPMDGGGECVLEDGTTGLNEERTVTCNEHPCTGAGGWGKSVMGNCSAPCDGGVQIETRRCDNPAPADGGDDCLMSDGVTRGLVEETTHDCNTDPCEGIQGY